MSILRKYPGLYRRLNQSLIIPILYDFDEEILFNKRIPLPYRGSDFTTKKEDICAIDECYRHMYKRMFEKWDMLAIVVIKGVVYIEVYNDKKVVTMVSDPSYVYVEQCDLGLPELNVTPVGFEKTYLKTDKVFATPARVYYNERTNKILVSGIWIPAPMELSQHKGKKIYTELCNTDYKYVLKGKDGNFKFYR